jgi:hypothetical protein
LVKVIARLREAPVASKTSTSRTSTVPTATSDGTLPPTVAAVVTAPGEIAFSGSWMSPTSPPSVTTPLTAPQPCTSEPSGLTRRPSASKSKSPARVYEVWLPSRVTKKPSPEIIRFVARPVAWVEPCAKLVEMPATSTPSPTWAGLVPPTPSWGPAAPVVSCESVSWNWADDDLNAVVLTLAMLLPVTSSMVWCERRPEIPA